MPRKHTTYLEIGDVYVNIDAWLQLERSDFLDQFRWAVEVDNSLVDSHFESVPGVGSLTARTLSDGHSQHSCWHSDWPLDLELVVLGGVDDLTAGSLDWLYVGS